MFNFQTVFWGQYIEITTSHFGNIFASTWPYPMIKGLSYVQDPLPTYLDFCFIIEHGLTS